MMISNNSGTTNVMRTPLIRETSVRRKEMIAQMTPNSTAKQTDIVTDREMPEYTERFLVPKSVSPAENSISISRFGPIAPAPIDPSREQISAPYKDPAAPQGRTEPVIGRAFDTDAKFSLVTDWMGQITRLWAKGNWATLELARIVSAARHALAHGEWTALFKPEPMPSKLPFAKRKGEMLVAVGDGLGWANAHVCAHLPSSLRTLYYLAKLDRTTLERLIEEEVIHPKLKESEARELVAQLLGKTLKKKSTGTILLEGLRRFENFLLAILPHCSPAEKQQAHAYLARLLAHTGAAGEPDRSRINIRVAA